MRNKQGSPLAGIIIAALMIVGGWLAYQHLTKPMADEADASELWMKTNGTITYSGIKKERDSDGKTMYSADIRYEFTVEGEVYEGDKVSFGSGFSSSNTSMAKKSLKKYPRLKSVDVYYDPEFPGSSVLEPGGNMWTVIIKYLPLLFSFFGIMLALNSIKRIFGFFLR